MIRAAARRATLLVCVSEYTADRLRALVAPRGDIAVVHHGVDHDRFSATGDETDDLAALAEHGIEPPYIAFASTIEPRKNVPTLVHAFARVAARAPRPATRAGRIRRMGRTRGPRRDRRERRRDPRAPARLPRRGDHRRASSGGPRWSRIRRSKRASGCPRSKGSRAAHRSSPPRAPRWPRSSATPRCSYRRPMPGALADALARILDDSGLRRTPASGGPGPRRASSRGKRASTSTSRRTSGPCSQGRAYEGAHHRRQRLRREVPRRRCSAAGDDVVSIDRSGRRSARHHRPATRSTTRSRATAPRSSTTSRRSRTSATRGTTRRSCSASTSKAPPTCSTRARAAVVRRVIVVGSAEEYGRVEEQRSAAPRRQPAAAVDAVRREQDRGVVPRAPGPPRVRVRRRARARVLPHRARANRIASSIPALAQRIAQAERDGARRDPRRVARSGA